MLPQEVIQLIGKKDETIIMEVEKGAIKKFADPIGDTNPLYWDEDFARNTEYGRIIAPPGFFRLAG
jgi:acyl dehydratase